MLSLLVVKRFSSTIKPLKDLIKREHETIRNAFKNYQQNPQDKQKWANECIRAIAVHSAAEEIAIYSQFKKLTHGEQDREHSLSDHQRVKELLYRMDKEKPLSRQYDHLLGQVMSHLEAHMKKEETDLMSQMNQVFSDQEVLKMMENYERLKKVVPTHPHPSAPTQPTLEAVVGVVQGAVDRIYDAMRREFPNSSNKKSFI